jgi:hypothetical protein
VSKTEVAKPTDSKTDEDRVLELKLELVRLRHLIKSRNELTELEQAIIDAHARDVNSKGGSGK